MLVLLDLSAAFDTVDHNILLERLENWVGLSGMALKWFRSYLEGRGYYVSIGEHKSKWTSMTCGVPQGSILAPLLFSLYMLPLSQIMRIKQIHSYADDTQIYLALSPNDYSPIDSLCQCIAMNYCNVSFQRRALARILTRTRTSEHLTPVLRSLHWLPVTFRIDFKVLILIYKSLNGKGPKYMQICSLNINLTEHSDH